ncbi:hypothetical protein CDV31_000581 [Fusarium ambrosium]|uniref:Uncharacterized protein n=1 Tax=Fusarium ambrosium TaxID=131363 RepID=A0A428V232_9HYPO|nr:hypothetical protein CDV31_000581 [Fusarium ambrosium]
MARLPPAEKLPLAVRKNIRDGWENKKEEWEKKLSDLLGESWTIDIDPKALYPYAEADSWASTSLGDCINGYVEGVEYQMRYFIDSNGGDGPKAEINNICSAHVLTMDFDEENTVSYCGVKVTPEGKLVILFTEGNLGTNTSYAAESSKLVKALNEGPTGDRPMSYIARASIRNDYEKGLPDVQKKLNKIFGKDVAIVPNFEDNFNKLKADKNAQDGWEDIFGRTHLSYLEGLVSDLEYQKFDQDEMLQEGLVEAVEESAVHVRVVDELKRSYNETVIENGILYLQTIPKDFGVNAHSIANELINLL